MSSPTYPLLQQQQSPNERSFRRDTGRRNEQHPGVSIEYRSFGDIYLPNFGYWIRCIVVWQSRVRQRRVPIFREKKRRLDHVTASQEKPTLFITVSICRLLLDQYHPMRWELKTGIKSVFEKQKRHTLFGYLALLCWWFWWNHWNEKGRHCMYCSFFPCRSILTKGCNSNMVRNERMIMPQKREARTCWWWYTYVPNAVSRPSLHRGDVNVYACKLFFVPQSSDLIMYVAPISGTAT